VAAIAVRGQLGRTSSVGASPKGILLLGVQAPPLAVLGQLPQGWREHIDPKGRKYYCNRKLRITQWDVPEEIVGELPPLPAGWEERKDPKGKVFYVNKSIRRSQRARPGPNDAELTAAGTSALTKSPLVSSTVVEIPPPPPAIVPPPVDVPPPVLSMPPPDVPAPRPPLPAAVDVPPPKVAEPDLPAPPTSVDVSLPPATDPKPIEHKTTSVKALAAAVGTKIPAKPATEDKPHEA
jgi:hypothetical protein